MLKKISEFLFVYFLKKKLRNFFLSKIKMLSTDSILNMD
ncbi:hypothetical protein RU88_GL001992 [Lactococcus raffinolactis]|nr:hypothetical protein RU88_GL001992 [Lactococcus raffinolactis]